MSEIPKGSVLQEVAPYAVVPLYDDQDGDVVGSKRRMDPTLVPGLEDLLKWKECRIWNQKPVHRTPETKKFLKRARRMASSSSDDVAASWKILCILTILRVVADNARDEKTQWWSTLVSEAYDDETERKMISCDDDDDGSLLVELWPLIAEDIPWMACQRLYRRIQNRMHVLTIPHPIKQWAQTTIFELTDDEFNKSWEVLQTAGETEALESPPNRLRASKLWLDRAANIPERLVGVLIKNPMVLGEHSMNGIEKSTAVTLPRRYQSHLPNTCLELDVASNTKIQCKWIALYDLDESDNQNRTLSTMPRPNECDLFDSNGNVKASPEINASNLAQARRLAHSHFFKEAFGDAISLYQKCHDYCSKYSKWKKPEADLWHTMGAVILSQQKFASAQEHWKNGSCYQSMHKEISEQLEKQKAYRYFDSLVKPSSCEISIQQQILKNPSSDASQSIFVASEVIQKETCSKLIAWAKDYAGSNGGWTASRHYAVPTTDLPIHKVPKLLEWFQEWMPSVLIPLLQAQFGDENNKRFYVHDAFLVRYEASSSSCFLPLHFDESTHSVVLALNDDFDGGGSYVYDLDQSIAPKTGGMVSFLGNQCLHGGNPVTRGERYILAIFLFQDRDLAESCGERGIKRRDEDEAKSKNSILAKRSKQDEDGLQSDQGGGGFSFSFF